MNKLILVGMIKLVWLSNKSVYCLVSTLSPLRAGELHIVRIPESFTDIALKILDNNGGAFFEGKNTKQLKDSIISRMEYMVEDGGFDIIPLLGSKKIREVIPFSVDDIPSVRPEINEDEDVLF